MGNVATSNAVSVDSTKEYIFEVDLGVSIVFTITIIIDADCFCSQYYKIPVKIQLK